MKKQAIFSTIIALSLSATCFAGGVNNTIQGPFGADAVGKSNNVAGSSAFAAGYNNTVSGSNAIIYGNSNTASGINSIAGGEYSKAAGRNSVAIGSSAQALKDNNFAIGSQARANGENAVAFGNGSYAENTDTIAIGKTTKATGEKSTAIGNTVTASGTRAVAIGSDIKAEGWAAVNIGIQNYGASAHTTIVGSNNNIDHTDHMVDPDGDVVVGTSNTIQDGYYGVAIGKNNRIDNADYAVAIGNDTTVSVNKSVAIGHEAKADTVTGTASASIADKTYNFAGNTPIGTVSIGTASKERTITNVAAGRVSDTSTDAINGSQLQATINAIDKNHKDIVDTTRDLHDLGDIVHEHNTAIADNTKLATDAMTEAKKHTTVAAGDNINVSTNTNANGSKEYTVSLKKDIAVDSVKFNNATDPVHNYVNKNGMITSARDVVANYNANGVYIENRSNFTSATHDVNGVTASSNNRHVAFTTDGIDAGNQTITNVAKGVNDNDAVNVSQLRDSETNIRNTISSASDVAVNMANHYTDLQTAKVGARAAAMANLHYQDFNADDKWSFAAGYGHYKGQNAGALGIAYQPNENIMISVSSTIGSDTMFGAGVSMKFGKSSKMNANKQAAMAKEIQELREIVAAQNEKINMLVDHMSDKVERVR